MDEEIAIPGSEDEAGAELEWILAHPVLAVAGRKRIPVPTSSSPLFENREKWGTLVVAGTGSPMPTDAALLSAQTWACAIGLRGSGV